MALDVAGNLLVDIRDATSIGARYRATSDRCGAVEGPEGRNAMDVAASVANENMAPILTRHTGIHRERVERVDQRRDLLSETHVEAHRPGQHDIAEHAQDAEAHVADPRAGRRVVAAGTAMYLR